MGSGNIHRMLVQNVAVCMILLATFRLQAQQYVRSNERAITSFYTKQHKRAVIAVDTADKYIVYRYGTSKKIELEYPGRDTASWRKMQFYWYRHPSSGENNGFDMYNISFVRDTFRYVVFLTNAGDEGGEHLGIIILNLKGKILAEIPGDLRTLKGHLMALRDYEELLSHGAEEYDDPNIN